MKTNCTRNEQKSTLLYTIIYHKQSELTIVIKQAIYLYFKYLTCS